METICFVFILIMCSLLFGDGQVMKSVYNCGYRSDAFSTCGSYGPERYLRFSCENQHVLLLNKLSYTYFNETKEQTCCKRLPEYYCTAKNLFNKADYRDTDRYILREFIRCQQSTSCLIRAYRFDSYIRRSTNNCSNMDYIVDIDYTCVSNTSLINMIQPGVYQSVEDLSLSYGGGYNTRPQYPKINGSFYCVCDITASDGASIYPTVYYIALSNSRTYNTSVNIYSRDLNITFNYNNKDMIQYQYNNQRLQFYKTLNKTRGPLYLVYEGDQLSYNDDIWVNFRASEGLMGVDCKGCKEGTYTPPVFQEDIKSTTGPTAPEIIKSTENSVLQHTASETSTGYRNAFISLMVIIVLVGIIILAVFIYRRKFSPGTKKQTKKQARATRRGGAARRGGGGGAGAGGQGTSEGPQERGVTRGVGSTEPPANVSDLYSRLDVDRTQAVYDNLNNHVYCNTQTTI